MKKILLPLVPVMALVTSCATHHQHASHHSHLHQPGCGHLSVMHNGHVDYLDAGHLHHAHGSHTDDHSIAVSATNPNQCTPGHGANEHTGNHNHGPSCGHEAVPHGDHSDYLVSGHLHHTHGNHCDDHGALNVKSN